MEKSKSYLPEYKVLPFFLFDGKEKIIQTDSGITIIENMDLYKLLKSWDTEQKKYVYKNELKEIFSSQLNELVDFLIQNRIMKRNSTTHLRINKVILFSDNERISNQLVDYFDSKFPELPQEVITDVNSITEMDENDLLIVSLTEYSYKIAEIVRRKSIQYNNLLLFGHVYAGNYYIDNFYKRDWYLPCHKCVMGNLQSQLRQNSFGEETYQALLDQIYEVDEDIVVSTSLYTNQQDLIAVSLFEKVRNFIGNGDFSDISPEKLSMVTMIDLVENKTSEDFSIHWELCDCYEKY